MKLLRTDPASQSWLQSANCDANYGRLLLGALALILGLSAIGEPARLALQYQRTLIAQGQWWRLISAHLVHSNWTHALLNSAGLALLWMLFAREFPPRRWAWILCGSCLLIDAGLWFLRPEVEWYVGASGVLHGALAAGAVAWYLRGDGFGAALILLLIGKLIYEQHTGHSAFEHDLTLLPEAHLFGAFGGLLAAWLPRRLRKPL